MSTYSLSHVSDPVLLGDLAALVARGIAWSNRIVERVLGTLNLTNAERGVIQGTLDTKIRE